MLSYFWYSLGKPLDGNLHADLATLLSSPLLSYTEGGTSDYRVSYAMPTPTCLWLKPCPFVSAHSTL